MLYGNSGEPIAKRNCFGWYLLGPVADKPSQVRSVTVNQVNAVAEDIHKLFQNDSLGVKPTKLCSYTDGVKFIKALNESIMLVDGRI